MKPRPVAYRDLEPNKLRPIWFLDYECWCAWRRWCKKTFPKLVLEEGFQERRDNDVTITDEWRSSEADMAEGEKVAVGGQERTDGEDGEDEGEDEDEDEYRSSRGRGVKETRSQTATKGSNISKAKGKGRACPPSATPPPSTNLRRDLKGKGKSREEIPADRKQAEQADESEHGDDTSTLGTPSRKRTRAGRQSTGINSGCEASPSKKRAGDLAAGVRPVRKGTSPYSPGTAMVGCLSLISVLNRFTYSFIDRRADAIAQEHWHTRAYHSTCSQRVKHEPGSGVDGTYVSSGCRSPRVRKPHRYPTPFA